MTEKKKVQQKGNPVVGAVVVLAVGAGLWWYLRDDDKSAQAPTTQAVAQQPTGQPDKPATSPRPKAAAVTVPLKELLSEYKDNEVRADSKFKGKSIETTGKVGDVKKGILGDTYVTVGTGKAFEIPMVQCFFGKDQTQKATSLSKGNKVTVRGRVDGLMMNVLVKDCEFID